MLRARLTCFLLMLPVAAYSAGGMWAFHDFPAQLVKREYGADISSAWLDRVRTATIRLSNCTASFVSADGLMLTNHHCAEACLDDHSSASHNLVRDGFLARTRFATVLRVPALDQSMQPQSDRMRPTAFNIRDCDNSTTSRQEET